MVRLIKHGFNVGCAVGLDDVVGCADAGAVDENTAFVDVLAGSVGRGGMEGGGYEDSVAGGEGGEDGKEEAGEHCGGGDMVVGGWLVV